MPAGNIPAMPLHLTPGYIRSAVLKTSSLEFELPPELIATSPTPRREEARLLVVARSRPSELRDMRVSDLPSLLKPRDLLVVNTTRVVPARLEGYRADTRGRVEGLFLHGEGSRWVCMLRGKSLRAGVVVALVGPRGEETPYALELVARDEEESAWVVTARGGGSPEDVLAHVGRTPLPPYILKARRAAGAAVDAGDDPERYQTVFAEDQHKNKPINGAVAAPTAGLHLTPELLERLSNNDITTAPVVLHVGAGTFKPVEAEHLEEHRMHAEWCSMPEQTRREIESRRGTSRVICVGTTSARTVESFALAHERGEALPEWMSTRLLVTPGYRWRWTNGLLTNFHLPRSTLLALVASLFDDGVPALLKIYEHAIRERYRFFSYGDAMLVLPD